MIEWKYEDGRGCGEWTIKGFLSPCTVCHAPLFAPRMPQGWTMEVIRDGDEVAFRPHNTTCTANVPPG